MENEADTTPPAPMRPEDKRAAELEHLRTRNLAKTMHGQLDGKGQPINKESWYQQQKEQSEQIRKQKMDAASNLHNFRNENVVSGDGVKQELKKKEMEAAAMLRNYRGTSDAVSSHQVKKISTVGIKDNTYHVHGFSPLSSPHASGADFEGTRSQFDNSAHDAVVPLATNAVREQVPELKSEDAGVEDFLESLDDMFQSTAEEKSLEVVEPEVSQNNSTDVGALGQSDTIELNEENERFGQIEKKSSESSNENSNDSSEWVVLTEDQKGARTMSDDFTKIDYDANDPNEKPALQDPTESKAPQPQPATPQWTNELVSISFGLLTGESDAPPEGSGADNQLLHEMVCKMRSMVSSSLQAYTQNGDVKLLDQAFDISVTKDGKIPVHAHLNCLSQVIFMLTNFFFALASYIAPQDRPFIIKSIVRMNIPLDVRNSCKFSRVEMVVRNALKNALFSIYP